MTTETVASEQAVKRQRHRRALVWTLLVILAGTMLLPMSGYVYVAVKDAYAANEQTANPRANYWRDVRQGNTGYTSVRGQETGVLIQNGGEVWREFRNGPLVVYGAAIMGLSLFVLILFHLFTGGAKLAEGRSGDMVYRWNMFERIVHWYVAVLFIVLAITGLSLLYGRAVLIPVFGLEGFAAWAAFSKAAHNYLALFFIAGLLVMIVMWIGENFFKRYDWEWFRKGGGYIGHKHPPAGKVNAGEKVWFWILLFTGVAVSVSGFYMNFPNFGFVRESMQWANVVHSGLGMLLIAVLFGHIYLGTLGNQGSFEGMWSGYVDRNWAKQHHSVWYEEKVEKGGTGGPGERAGGTPKTV